MVRVHACVVSADSLFALRELPIEIVGKKVFKLCRGFEQ